MLAWGEKECGEEGSGDGKEWHHKNSPPLRSFLRVAFNVCLFSLFFMRAYVCLSPCMCTICIQELSEVKGHPIPQTGVTSSCEQTFECWEPSRLFQKCGLCSSPLSHLSSPPPSELCPSHQGNLSPLLLNSSCLLSSVIWPLLSVFLSDLWDGIWLAL